MKTSNLILVIGLAVLLAGAVMSMLDIRPWSDYVLVAGAVIVVIRGAVRSRER